MHGANILHVQYRDVISGQIITNQLDQSSNTKSYQLYHVRCTTESLYAGFSCNMAYTQFHK